MKASKVYFNADALQKKILKGLIQEQTDRLIEYAKEKILELGNNITSYNSKNGMDRSGHLLNSLCWGVAYNGELVEYGFFRDAVLKTHSTWFEKSTTNSYLHEWIPEYEAFPVNGRAEAERYISRYGKAGSAGCWRVFFAILAPYWGYWEEGFSVKRGKNGGTSFKKFAVMSQLYDTVGKDLKPAKVKFNVTKDIYYTKSYNVRGIKGHKSRVRSSIERQYDRWIKRKR